MSDDQQRGWCRSLLSIPPVVVVTVVLPILYLASVGPLYGLNDRGVLSDDHWDAIAGTVYFPLVYLDDETDFFDTPVGEAYVWYLELFAD